MKDTGFHAVLVHVHVMYFFLTSNFKYKFSPYEIAILIDFNQHQKDSR